MNSGELIKLIEGNSIAQDISYSGNNTMTNAAKILELPKSKTPIEISGTFIKQPSSFTMECKVGTILLTDTSDEDSVFSDKENSELLTKEDLEENEANNIGSCNTKVDESIYKCIFDEDSENEEELAAKKAKTEPRFLLNYQKENLLHNSNLALKSNQFNHQISQDYPYRDQQFVKNYRTTNIFRANSIPTQMQHSFVSTSNYSNASYLHPSANVANYFPNCNNMFRMSYHNQTHNLQNRMQSNNFTYYTPINMSNYSSKANSSLLTSSSSIYPRPQTQSSDKSFRDSISIELIMMMLEDKINSKVEITLNDYNIFLKDRVLCLISSKESSKKMQKCICLLTPEVINAVFNEILPNVIASLKNNFCNYFYQRFFKNLNTQQRLKILWLFKENHFFSLCCLKAGVYLVISVIEKISTTEEMNLVDSVLGDRLLELLTNSNGYRVLEKITLRFDEKYFNHLFNPIFSNFVNFSKDPSACEVLKVLLSKINKNNKLCKMFAQLISENLLELASDKVATSIVVASLYVRF